jgi:hypothetical protein
VRPRRRPCPPQLGARLDHDRDAQRHAGVSAPRLFQRPRICRRPGGTARRSRTSRQPSPSVRPAAARPRCRPRGGRGFCNGIGETVTSCERWRVSRAWDVPPSTACGTSSASSPDSRAPERARRAPRTRLRASRCRAERPAAETPRGQQLGHRDRRTIGRSPRCAERDARGHPQRHGSTASGSACPRGR